MPRHPWHAAIVHFPVAFWVLASVLDAGRSAARLLGAAALPLAGVDPAAASYLLLWAGDVFAAAAIGAGIVDYVGLASELQDSRNLLGHIAAMSCATMLFFPVSLWRARAPIASPPAAWFAVGLELAGTACLLVGGWLAARLVYAELPRYVQLDRH